MLKLELGKQNPVIWTEVSTALECFMLHAHVRLPIATCCLLAELTGQNCAQARLAKLTPEQMRVALRSACGVRERLISVMTAAQVLVHLYAHAANDHIRLNLWRANAVA